MQEKQEKSFKLNFANLNNFRQQTLGFEIKKNNDCYEGQNNQQGASQSLDILNCFDNLSLVIQEESKNNNQNIGIYSGSSILGMSDFQINKVEPKFCVQLKKYQKWSLSNSPEEVKNQQCQRTFVKQGKVLQHHQQQQQNQNIKKQKFQQQKQKSKMTESILQQYSFNVQQSNASSAFNLYLPPKQNLKAPFAILIQKLDTLLKRQAQKQKEHHRYFESKPSTLNNSGIVLNSLINPSKDTSSKNSQLKKNQSQNQSYANNSHEINNLLQKIQFYASYVQKLQEESISIKTSYQKLFQQNELINAKVNMLENNLKQKDIIIKYLTEQISILNTNIKNDNTKNNVDSKLYRPMISKRNTIGGQVFMNENEKLSSFGNSYNKNNVRRASEHQECAQKNQKNLANLSFNKKNKDKENLNSNQNLKNDFFNKNDKNLITKNISSQRLSFGSFANSSNNKNSKKISNNQFQQVPKMLKKQNELLITKLNILYEDYQNLISKFNQMCSQKEIQGQLLKKQCINNGNFDYQFNMNRKNQNYHQNECNKNYKQVIQLGYQKNINQIINQIKNKTILKPNKNKSAKILINFPKEQFQQQKTLKNNCNRHFQTEESRGLFEQKLEESQPYLFEKKIKKRTKSQLNSQYPISQPQTQRIFFNSQMKPAIFSYNNSFCEEINDSNPKYDNNNHYQKKSYLQVNFKKNKPEQCQVQKRRSRQAPKSDRNNNAQKLFKFGKIQ